LKHQSLKVEKVRIATEALQPGDPQESTIHDCIESAKEEQKQCLDFFKNKFEIQCNHESNLT
jgi:hypothetical protein